MNGRIGDEVHEGTVKFFCRSRGHGFIDDDDVSTSVVQVMIVHDDDKLDFQDPYPIFMHISDIDGEYIPRRGDRVKYRVCPMPPRFDKPQGVHITIIDFTPEVHRKWSEKETPEEFAEDAIALKEEKALNEMLKGPGPLQPGMLSPPRRPSCDPVPE